MPNWCENHLAVRGPAQDVQRFREKAIGHSPWLKPEEIVPNKPDPLNFHSLYPVPGELVKAGYNEAAYHWEREHWGCKWGACETQVTDECDGYVAYYFLTPWSPPVEFIEQVARDWSTLRFVLDYEEPGNGFKGLAKVQANQIDHLCVGL